MLALPGFLELIIIWSDKFFAIYGNFYFDALIAFGIAGRYIIWAWCCPFLPSPEEDYLSSRLIPTSSSNSILNMNASTSYITATPAPAYATHNSRAACNDPFSSSGYTFFAPSPSRHDRRVSAEFPPAYMESEAMPPPSYSLKDEPATLAMYLFKFGFRTSFTSPIYIDVISDIPNSIPSILDYGCHYPIFASTCPTLVGGGG